jgi:nicotinate-nucleotide adenylyltransferase
MSRRRIGAYGGTFDPIHLGHTEIARAVTEKFQLDQLLIVPAFNPPHKRSSDVASSFHRFAMAAMATIDDPKISVTTVELDVPERPYTFQTVERLYALYGQDIRLFFVMGADSFVELMTWREPERLMSTVSIIVAARPGIQVATSHLSAKFREKVRDIGSQGCVTDEEDHLIYLTSYVSRDISSSEIRRRAREGASIEEMVPDRVADFVEKYGLYRT